MPSLMLVLTDITGVRIFTPETFWAFLHQPMDTGKAGLLFRRPILIHRVPWVGSPTSAILWDAMNSC